VALKGRLYYYTGVSNYYPNYDEKGVGGDAGGDYVSALDYAIADSAIEVGLGPLWVVWMVTKRQKTWGLPWSFALLIYSNKAV
jgi:hypothetical protein